MPQTALELAAVIGIEAACILIDRYGGQKIPAAKGITGQGRKTIAAYAELIGGKAAERLQNGIFMHLDDSGYHVPIIGDAQFVKAAKQVEVDAGDEAVFEFGIGEAVPLSEQDGFEHGQQGIGGTAAVVSKVTGFLTIQVLFDRLPINHLIQLQ